MSAPRPAATVVVWDPVVRLVHWGLVVAVVVAWVSTLRWGHVGLHEPAGYVVAALVALRVLWGVAGSPAARFASFMRGPRATWRHVRLLAAGREPHFMGHNPLGGWMTAVLLAGLAMTAFSGWLFTTDRFWGDASVAQVHAAAAWTVAGLVTVHLCGVGFMSWRLRQNLPLAMLTGRKAAPAKVEPAAGDGSAVSSSPNPLPPHP